MKMRIFPSLSLKVTGLCPSELYTFFIDMVLVQPNVFKHNAGQWVVSGQADEYPPQQLNCPLIYIQEDSPKLGSYWMESGVNFTRVKITNSKTSKSSDNMIYVYSMHQYLPRIHIARKLDPIHPARTCGLESSRFGLSGNHAASARPAGMGLELVGSYVIPGTQFHTVTAYQNPDVIRVKIENNPFAKGFRNRQDELKNEEMCGSAGTRADVFL
ncbi:unnamed protein product [Protopolystoma xenopodis]|uniref:T-box domain-containing protein n=1 Tax=Protopolystoma xenopodis TaxID=117903 RepID=A0A448XF97_9PLAT|nr:unnamed protein product [Protopolystoma xenopodis]